MLLQFRRRHGKSHSARMQTHSTCCSDGPLPESEWLDLRVGVPEDWASISLPGIHSRSILVALSAKRNCVMRWLTRWDIAGSRDRRRSSPLSGKECRRSVIRRSEEHTSELQSRRDLVCRLLLEKKKRMRWLSLPWLETGPPFRARRSQGCLRPSCAARLEPGGSSVWGVSCQLHGEKNGM